MCKASIHLLSIHTVYLLYIVMYDILIPINVLNKRNKIALTLFKQKNKVAFCIVPYGIVTERILVNKPQVINYIFIIMKLKNTICNTYIPISHNGKEIIKAQTCSVTVSVRFFLFTCTFTDNSFFL